MLAELLDRGILFEAVAVATKFYGLKKLINYCIMLKELCFFFVFLYKQSMQKEREKETQRINFFLSNTHQQQAFCLVRVAGRQSYACTPMWRHLASTSECQELLCIFSLAWPRCLSQFRDKAARIARIHFLILLRFNFLFYLPF